MTAILLYDRVSSAGTPLSAMELDAVIKRITASWKDGADRVVTIDTFDALPAAIPKETDQQGTKQSQIQEVLRCGHLYTSSRESCTTQSM